MSAVGPMGGAKGPLIYLAGRYSRREELIGYGQELAVAGIGRVEARWLTEDHDWDGSQQPGGELEAAQRFATDDVEDLAASHAVVVFTEEPAPGGRNRGGRHVEYGLAIGLRKHVIVVGPAENVFHTLPSVPRFAEWEQAKAHLAAWREAVERSARIKRLSLPS